ncbi:MAG: amidohydrolase family protein [Clostridiaceae bacterium]
MQILLKNANVIHVDNESICKSDVLIENGLIKSINQSITYFQPDTQIVDCHNKWILPGLIDMHVHIKEGFSHLFTAAGVTTVRNLAGSVLELEDMMNADNSAKTPRVISADRMIDGSPGLWGATSPYNFITDDTDTARNEVRRQIQLGADLIKVYGLLKPNVMAAVCDEASKSNKVVSCDLLYSSQVNAVEAAKIGVSWNEHASGIVQMLYPGWTMQADEAIWNSIDWNNLDLKKIQEICEELLKYDVKICPTITIYDQAYLADKPWRANHIVTTKVEENTGLINQWQYILKSGLFKKRIGIQHNIIKTIAKVYHSIGGTVVCGTDSPGGIFTYPGMALHRELELFVESGFTEFEAIKAATIISADSLNRKDLGRVVEGTIADLVILNSNPIDSISNSKDIFLIVKGGTVYTPQELIEAVPSEKENIEIIEKMISKFKKYGLPVDMHRD